MSKFWRIAFAWMLALALPVQGYAAHAMMHCGPAHTGMASAHEQVAHDLDEAGHSAHVAHASVGAPADDGLAKIGATKTAGVGKCSACSSCCSAAAIVTAIVQIEVVSQHPPVVATIAAVHARVLIGGLERPPRFSLA